MKILEINGTISAEKNSWDNELRYHFHAIEFGSEYWGRDYMLRYTPIAPYKIEIEVPDNVLDLVYSNTLKNLQIKRKLILVENQKRVNNIDAQISELQAIENKSEGAE